VSSRRALESRGRVNQARRELGQYQKLLTINKVALSAPVTAQGGLMIRRAAGGGWTLAAERLPKMALLSTGGSSKARFPVGLSAEQRDSDKVGQR